jgi:ADP-ribose pyrophosphatase YjhB (NUDIX family)
VSVSSDTHPIARPRIAAGALFLDHEGRILLVRPTYKPMWDIPGGYVEPGESPLAACLREVREELGVELPISQHLVVDWAPAEQEGDKILFIFDGGALPTDQIDRLTPDGTEVADLAFVEAERLDDCVPDRLARRLRAALSARHVDRPVYAEHGVVC